MIDWHCHLLPGVDDGPATMDESVALAHELVRAGFRTVYCTPHLIRGRFQADNRTVKATLAALQSELDRHNLPLRLLPGREYCLDEFLLDHLKDPLPLGDTRFLLIELSANLPVEFVKDTCYLITSRGFTPVIAHPERCPLFFQPKAPDLWAKAAGAVGALLRFRRGAPHHEPEESLLAYLQTIGCGFQGNLGSFAGRYGQAARATAEFLRDHGVYTFYGTDSHSPRGVKGLIPLLRAEGRNQNFAPKASS